MGRITVRLRDYSDEYSSFSVPVADLEGTDVWTVVTGLAGGLETALAGAVRGTVVAINYTQGGVAEDDNRPASAEAAREQALRLFYRDDVDGNRGTISIGTVDWGALAQPATDLVPLDHAEVAPLVAWFEANMLSVSGNPITIESAALVGRSN